MQIMKTFVASAKLKALRYRCEESGIAQQGLEAEMVEMIASDKVEQTRFEMLVRMWRKEAGVIKEFEICRGMNYPKIINSMVEEAVKTQKPETVEWA